MILTGLDFQARGPLFEQAARGDIIDTGHPALEAMFRNWVDRYHDFAVRRYDSASKGDGTWQGLAQSTILARAHRLATTTAFRRTLAEGATPLAEHYNRQRLAYSRQLRAAGDRQAGAHATAKALKEFRAAGGRVYTRRQDFDKKYGNTMSFMILRDTGMLFGALNMGAEGSVLRREGMSVTYGIGGPAEHGPRGHATIGQIANYHQHGGGRLPQRTILVPPPENIIQGMLSDARRAIMQIFGGA